MTAPALPGAAPDPARLPPEVEATMAEAFRRAIEAGYDAAPDDKYFGAGNTEVAMDVLLASKPVAALRTAIARALGGDGEPVAWGVFDKNDCLWRSFDSQRDAERESASLNAREDTGHFRACGPYRVVPLYTRPAATGDTGVSTEVERRAVALLEKMRETGAMHCAAHARLLPVGPLETCACRPEVVALRAAIAAKGGPDAR